jgi:hypothetical protein
MVRLAPSACGPSHISRMVDRRSCAYSHQKRVAPDIRTRVICRDLSNTHQRQKQKPRIAPGPLLSTAHLPSKGMSIFAAAFRSSHVVGAGTSVALIRRIRGTTLATCARPCGHAFFVLRFLARGGAGTDGSFAGRAGRGLILSRRNERRTEQRRHDKSRDCKFGSHQKCLRGLQDSSKPRQAIWFRCVTYIAKISFPKGLVCCRRATAAAFLTSVTFRTQDLRKTVSLIFARLDASQTSSNI